MTKWLRRIRGAFGMGLTWAMGWAPVGAAVSFAVALASGGPLAGIIEATLLYAASGFVVGAAVAIVGAPRPLALADAAAPLMNADS